MGTEGFEPPSAGTSHGTSKMVNHRPKGLIAPYLEPAILARLYYAPNDVMNIIYEFHHIQKCNGGLVFARFGYNRPNPILARLCLIFACKV
jgi:hypothetical protein